MLSPAAPGSGRGRGWYPAGRGANQKLAAASAALPPGSAWLRRRTAVSADDFAKEPLMRERLGILADIHANALALDAVLRDAQRRGVARFVNLGDILYGPLDPLETYRKLHPLDVVASIAGNQDRLLFEATPEEIAASPTLAFVAGRLGREPIVWLRTLPAACAVADDLYLCHGTPRSDTTYLLEDVVSGHPVVRSDAAVVELLGDVRAPVVLCGHTHIPRVVRLSTGQLIVNPGSVGLPAYGDDLPVVHRMETHSPHASYAVLEQRAQGWDVSLHRVAYDWEQAAMQARAAGRDDWAVALTTGRAA
jgi:predicted phosphodiesterase